MATQLLLADDSPTIHKILQMSLAGEPYEIRAVLTAEEAIKELKSNTPYFFLVDLGLPETNGYQFARMIRRDPKLRQIRVVLLASAFEPVDETEYQACGADAVVKKPFDPAELRSQLRAIHDAPPKFPDGSHVTGSLSGFMVISPDDGTSAGGGIIVPPTAPVEDPTEALLGNTPASPNSEADAILAGLINGDAPPLFSPAIAQAAGKAEYNTSEFTNATIVLDTSEGESLPKPPEGEFDLSAAFSTPPGGTAIIDVSVPEDKTPAPPLSANAQALAAFFEAEINSQPPVAHAAAPAPPAETELPVPAADSFDASLSSIEWNEGPAEASLNEWSSSQPKGGAQARPASTDAPPPFKKEDAKTTTGFSPLPAGAAAKEKPKETLRETTRETQRDAPRAAAPSPAAGGSTASMMFDTGGSSFRFSDDYITRITKSFSGAVNETIPESHVPPAKHVFPQHSDDRHAETVPATAPEGRFREGGGAWSEGDVQKIEKIVREEVQMVVREVAEKIAWEVIPELAENLIRKELERVLKEMGQ